MQTNLPDLPFTDYGRADLRPFGTHSIGKSTPRTYPRTDLQTITPWTSFPDDIDRVIQSATDRAHVSSAPFTIKAWTRASFVQNEESIRAHATYALHAPVEEVLEKLGVNGWFSTPGGGNAAILGAPDFSWVTSTAQLHPKVIIEYKMWWAVDVADVVTSFNAGHSSHALQQIYGYMTFNNTKFGILTNWQHALFLCRTESSDCKTLAYYSIRLEDGPGQAISMLKAWVGMVLLAEDDWSYASPTQSAPPPGRNFGTSKAASQGREIAVDNAHEYHMQPVNGKYQCVALDFRLCQFDINSARCGANSCVVNTRFLTQSFQKRERQVVCKVVDVLRYPDTAEMLGDEARAYAALQNLQGKVIPTLYGYYEVWGILQLLALESVGNAIPEDEQINQELRMKMKAALQHIHDAGFVHGDIARRNFCRTESGDVFLVDLERCQAYGNLSELGDEMNEVDGL